MTGLPPPPQNAAEMTLALAICQHVKGQKLPASWLHNNAPGDPHVLQAVLNLPRFLTGMSESELTVIREKARRTLHPVQAQHQDDLNKALSDLRNGVEATKRLLRERCQIPALTSMPGQKQTEPAA